MAIIGTLSSIGVVSYGSARASARDVKRVSDMKQIQTALELSFENNSYYPGDRRPGSEGMLIGGADTRFLSDGGFAPQIIGTEYMLNVPANPQPGGTPYVYRSLNRDGGDCNAEKCDSYAILFTLERSSGNYLAGGHAMTPTGVAGAEGGYAGEGVTAAGGEIVGINAIQAQLDRYATETTAAVSEFVDDPLVERVAEAAVAPTVATVAVANTALTTTSAASYIFYFITQPLVLLGRKRRKAWGVVYNSLSRLPEDLVILRLRDERGRVVKSTVSDIKGRFSFLVPHGRYRIEAAKNGFVFPSAFTVGKKEDGPFTDLYHGEPIDVDRDGAILTPNVPLDPAERLDATDSAILKKVVSQKTHRAVALLSPVLGGLTFAIKPSIVVGLLFAAQVVVYLLFRRLAATPQPKSWGIVYDRGTQKPVSKAILRIFEAKYNKLLETQVTDGQGRYHFRVGGNVYYLTVTKPGYVKTETDPIDLSSAVEPTVIASDLPLLQATASATPPPATRPPTAPPPAPTAPAPQPVAPPAPPRPPAPKTDYAQQMLERLNASRPAAVASPETKKTPEPPSASPEPPADPDAGRTPPPEPPSAPRPPFVP